LQLKINVEKAWLMVIIADNGQGFVIPPDPSAPSRPGSAVVMGWEIWRTGSKLLRAL